MNECEEFAFGMMAPENVHVGTEGRGKRGVRGKRERKRCFGVPVGGFSVRKIQVHAGNRLIRRISQRYSFVASVAFRIALPNLFTAVPQAGRDES